MTVQFWTLGDQLRAGLVFCRSAETAALRAEIQSSGIAVTAFEVAPNGEPYKDLLHCLLALRADPEWVPAGNYEGSIDSAWITRNFQRLALGLSRWDDAAAASAIKLLKQHVPALHPQQVKFLDFCEGLVSNVIRRLLWGSPLQLAWPPQYAARQWWAMSTDLDTEIASQVRDLKACFHGSVPSNLQGLSVWLNQLRSRLSTQLFGSSREAALTEASALCGALSLVHFTHSRYALATLLAHRAADLLFTAICSGENLIDFTKRGGEGELFTAILSSGERHLSLLNCHDALVQAFRVPADQPRRELLSHLNSTRNRLLLTHSLGSPFASDAKTNLQAIVALLKSFGGVDWGVAYNTYRSGAGLRAQDFFEVSDGLVGTLTPI
jgi:hypothetical protein